MPPQHSPNHDAPQSPTTPTLGGYEVVVCVTGGIAAYKTAAVVSQLVQQACGVTVAMTRAARRFVTPITFRALTGRAVHTSMWGTTAESDIQHLSLTERADLVVVAPATANIIGKLAGGIADDLVSTLLLGSDCPLIMVPAMNTRMWEHPATQRNLTFLREIGVSFIGPDEGYLACGTRGPGRMSAPEQIAGVVSQRLRANPPRSQS